jgi:SAM-dependent methyltransferase
MSDGKLLYPRAMSKPPTPDARLHAPATERNRDPILGVLRQVLASPGPGPDRPLVLEVASGTGQHAAWFAPALPGFDWQPSDPDPANRASIAAWTAGIPNIRPPIALDASAPDWPLDRADAVLCVNMIHIAPWEAGLGLLAGSARLLGPGRPLILYGPYRRGGRHTAPSNEAFDADLQRRDLSWGVRDLDDVSAAASAAGFGLDRVVEMPANNLSVVFRRR